MRTRASSTPTCHPHRAHDSRGLCHACYERARRSGKLTDLRQHRAPGDDLWRHIESRTIDGPNGCRDWTGGTLKFGYPAIWDGERQWHGNRLVLTRKLGRPIRDGYLAMHTCDRPICINPAHLVEGTYADNSTDMVQKERSARGERAGNARLTAAAIAIIRSEYVPYKRGHSLPALAKRFGVSVTTIHHVVIRSTWR